MKKTTKTAMPRSRAKTADGLLASIQRLIKEEPLRYDQHDILHVKGVKENCGDPDCAICAEAERLKFPTCNTIGCVAGWTVALTQKDCAKVIQEGRVLRVATMVLGLNANQSDELFCQSFNATPQTPKHAEAGVRHIAAFREKYRDQLRAKRIDQ